MMPIAQVMSYLLSLMSAAAELSTHAAEVSAILETVHKSGRTELTADEWKQVVGLDNAARDKLQKAIDANTLPGPLNS